MSKKTAYHIPFKKQIIWKETKYTCKISFFEIYLIFQLINFNLYSKQNVKLSKHATPRGYIRSIFIVSSFTILTCIIMKQGKNIGHTSHIWSITIEWLFNDPWDRDSYSRLWSFKSCGGSALFPLKFPSLLLGIDQIK